MFGRESPAKMLVSSGLPGGQRLGEGEVGGCCAGYCWLLLVAAGCWAGARTRVRPAAQIWGGGSYGQWPQQLP